MVYRGHIQAISAHIPRVTNFALCAREARSAKKFAPSAERASERSSDRASERAIERASERSSERAIERASDRASERSSERSSERAIERSSERAIERAIERSSEVHRVSCMRVHARLTILVQHSLCEKRKQKTEKRKHKTGHNSGS